MFSFDFGDEGEIAAGEVIESATVTAAPSGLTIGPAAPDSDGSGVLVQISGGQDGVRYKVTCLATTDEGHVLSACGYLDVANCS